MNNDRFWPLAERGSNAVTLLLGLRDTLFVGLVEILHVISSCLY